MEIKHPVPAVWDIFCKVVDNFGDAGVCWRLAQILHREHGLQVRLWLDGLATLHALAPAVDPAVAAQQVEGISILRWTADKDATDDAAVVIEAFGCGLPDAYVARMAARPRPPLWIVLEYLSAESWVDSHHGLASPHPRLPLQRYFFFPGFTAATGGLLREADLIARREAFDDEARSAFWRDLNFDVPAPSALTVSLFAYADAPVTALLTAIANDGEPAIVAVPDGVLMPAVRAFFRTANDAARTWRRGALEVRALPFLPQAGYDELLWACDLNFVRGEDSLVRALWAARPLVWQPYRQDDGAHQRKMDAFLQRYCAGMPAVVSGSFRALWQAWNSDAAAWNPDLWPAFRAVTGDLGIHAGRRARELADSAELAAQLVEFVRSRVE